MYRRRILVTGLAIVGAIAGCAGDDGNGGTTQTERNGTPETERNGTTQTEKNGTTQTERNETTQTEKNGTTQTETNGTTQTTDSTSQLSGVETYSGEWSGTIGGQSFSGEWQFEADFDEDEVEGRFWGDGEGNITGTVSDRELDAQGGAAFGTVEWSGEFSPDGQEISGTWELASDDIPSSGEWSGSIGETTDQEE